VALAKALTRFTADPAAAFSHGEAGRRKVEAEFTPEAHLDRLERIYREARSLAGRP
jgi:glycosyltransferase involved in cell wall biosynthesis